MQGGFTVPLPTTAPRACVVCAKPLDRSLPLTVRKAAGASGTRLYPLCIDPACRWIFDQAEEASDAEFRLQLRWRAQTWGARRERMRREEETRALLLRERADAEAREEAAAFAVIARREKTDSPSALHLVVPSGRRPSRPLGQRRRRAYEAHLDAIIAAAEAPVPAAAAITTMVQPAQADAAAAAPPSLSQRLCGACGGGCCPLGADHALLSEATIRRVFAANPGLDGDQVRALYLAYLPSRSVSGSCVNHTDAGCSLPRQLRSDTCNTWLCAPLERLQDGLRAEPPVRMAIVLRRRQNLWNRDNLARNNDVVAAAILTEAGTMRLRPPKSGSWTTGRAAGPDPS